MTEANLRSFTDENRRQIAERYEGFQAGGGGLVAKEEILTENAICAWTGDALTVTFAQSGGQIEGTVRALDLPADWEGFDRLQAVVSAGGAPVTVELVILGARCRVVDPRPLAAGETATLDIDLIDLPIAAGIRPLYQPTGIRLLATWEGEGERTVEFRSLALVPGAGAKRPCVDPFGQRVNGEWPGKIGSLEQLRAHIEVEARELKELTPHPDRDLYGGWTGGPQFTATGFFRVEQDGDGRWWLVDPLGNPFWSVGVTGIRTTDVTRVAGREFLFEELPDPQGPYGRAYFAGPEHWENAGPGNFSFYRYNVLRKWGSFGAWRERVLQRLQAWGMNTVANWSERPMMDQQEVPHTRNFTVRRDAPGVPHTPTRFADVFDPRWETFVDEQCAEHAGPQRDNPWVLGFFVDNEAPWNRLQLLDIERDTILRDRWLEFIQGRYADLAAFNQAWGLHCSSWEAVQELTGEAVTEGPAQQDLRAFEELYADTYFSTIARLLKKHAPNHLYLGCRFVRRVPDNQGLVRAAGRHCDVVSVNCYAFYPTREEFGEWFELAQRPLIIGEHHLPLWSERQLQPLYQAFTTEERFEGYQKFLYEWASQPYAVGCHWFQHADQPLTGRVSDGEDQTIGFVDITDQPHRELVAAVREVAARIYEWHSEAR